METVKQSGLWNSLGNHGYVLDIWWLCTSSSGGTRKFDFLNQFDLVGHDQLPLKTKGILTKLFSTSGPILVILAWMGKVRTRSKWDKFWLLN